MNIFDRGLKSIQRGRLIHNQDLSYFYYNELGVSCIINRLHSIVNKSYENACFIGPMAHLFTNQIPKGFLGIKQLTVVDNNKQSLDLSLSNMSTTIKTSGLCMDEEKWVFPPNYFDLIINNLQLHWVNDVYKTGEKWLNSLKPDGTLIGTALGGDTLQELRISLSLAEQEREGGISTHVSPMLHITDVGQILIRLNYKMITANADLNTFYFDDSFALMNFLQGIGENNASVMRRSMLGRDTFIAADAIYRSLFAEKSGKFEGKIPATFELVHYIGWKEHSSQRKPLGRGTKGVDIKTLAEEIDDSEMEHIEINDNDSGVNVTNIKGTGNKGGK